jgi:hypothetical protein
MSLTGVIVSENITTYKFPRSKRKINYDGKGKINYDSNNDKGK